MDPGKTTKVDTLASAKKDDYKKRMNAESVAKEAKGAKVLAKNTPPAVEEAAPVVEESAPAAEVATPEADAPKTDAEA